MSFEPHTGCWKMHSLSAHALSNEGVGLRAAQLSILRPPYHDIIIFSAELILLLQVLTRARHMHPAVVA